MANLDIACDITTHADGLSCSAHQEDCDRTVVSAAPAPARLHAGVRVAAACITQQDPHDLDELAGNDSRETVDVDHL